MIDNSKYHPKAIRNKTNPNTEEQAYAEMEVRQEVDKLLTRFHGEPKFLKDVAVQLAYRALHQERQENAE